MITREQIAVRRDWIAALGKATQLRRIYGESETVGCVVGIAVRVIERSHPHCGERYTDWVSMLTGYGTDVLAEMMHANDNQGRTFPMFIEQLTRDLVVAEAELAASGPATATTESVGAGGSALRKEAVPVSSSTGSKDAPALTGSLFLEELCVV